MGNQEITCIFLSNIPSNSQHLWHVMMDSLPKDCGWLIGSKFNMTDCPEYKPSECGGS